MRLRSFQDSEGGDLHIHRHGVTEWEVEEVLLDPLEDRRSAGESQVAVGQTAAGRYVKVIYVPDKSEPSKFVITAYDLGRKARQALSRRMKRRLQ